MGHTPRFPRSSDHPKCVNPMCVKVMPSTKVPSRILALAVLAKFYFLTLSLDVTALFEPNLGVFPPFCHGCKSIGVEPLCPVVKPCCMQFGSHHARVQVLGRVQCKKCHVGALALEPEICLQIAPISTLFTFSSLHSDYLHCPLLPNPSTNLLSFSYPSSN